MDGLNETKLRVICGDSLSELRNIPSATANVIIADPPYNLGKDYGNDSDNQTTESYIGFTKQWTDECKRILTNDGTLYVFMGFRFISYLYQILEESGELFFNNWICWHYTQGIGKRKGFSPRHDDILMFVKSPGFYFDLDAIRIPQKFYRSVNNMRGANPGDVWEFSHVHYCHENRQTHPTQKPEGLIERLVMASSKPGDLIVDPFSGSGTTLRVCQQLKRNCVGIEINSEYVEQTWKRLENQFLGFDSIDPRMERIPNDLNDEQIRNDYLQNHVHWFLQNHQNAETEFWKTVEKKYGQKVQRGRRVAEQTTLF